MKIRNYKHLLKKPFKAFCLVFWESKWVSSFSCIDFDCCLDGLPEVVTFAHKQKKYIDRKLQPIRDHLFIYIVYMVWLHG